MQFLTDCEILDYCHSNTEERAASFQRAMENQVKPIYQLPMFELCHALHVLVKYHAVSPKDFRTCWADLCKKHIESGEYFIHVSEEDTNDLLSSIFNLPLNYPEDLRAPCEDEEHYWGHNKHLIYRLSKTHKLNSLDNWWDANPPEEFPAQPEIKEGNQDVVLDTNNLIELVNQLSSDGFQSEADIRFPARLLERTQRKFLEIIRTRGTAGKFIVPISTLEEAQWVINKPDNIEKYMNARKVFKAMLAGSENSLWNIFNIESLSQEIFDYFLLLYERLELTGVNFADFDDFGDLIVLAHGLYHGCKIATNEWFEGETDIWDIVAPLYPFLVLEQ